MNKIKMILENIISNALWDLIKSLLALPITVIFILFKNLYIIPILFIIMVSALGIIQLIKTYKNNDYKYILLSKKLYFEYGEQFSIYNFDCNVRACTQNINFFYGRNDWNPNLVEMKCISHPTAEIKNIPQKGIYNKYHIIFNNKIYNKNDEYNVIVESKMNGEVKYPCFATTIVKPTKTLEIKIKLPMRLLNTTNIILYTQSTPEEIGISQKTTKLLDVNGDYGEYTWKIKNPKLTYEYGIEWDFTEEKLKQINK